MPQLPSLTEEEHKIIEDTFGKISYEKIVEKINEKRTKSGVPLVTIYQVSYWIRKIKLNAGANKHLRHDRTKEQKIMEATKKTSDELLEYDFFKSTL